MSWTNLSYVDYTSLTSTKMTRLYDNITALAVGDTLSPKIQQAAIDAAEVGQGELKTATASTYSTNMTSPFGTRGSVTALTGGSYSWWVASSSGVAGASRPSTFGNMWDGPFGPNPGSTSGQTSVSGDVAAGSIALTKYDADVGYVFGCFDERYIQASPPYDLGDGDVPLFIFAIIDNATGEIESISVAPDPTWAYHGPTNIKPTRRDGKRAFVTERYVGDTGFLVSEAPANLLVELMQGKHRIHRREKEITKQYKNKDMNTHSHPWCYNGASYFVGKTVIMVDPFCKHMRTILDIYQQATAKEASETIREFFAIDNLALERARPNGLSVHGLKFKGAQ